MTTPTPAWLNHPWWLLLRDGRESDHAHWFDVDWDAEDGRVLVPVLGQSLEAVLAAGELSLAKDGGRHGDEVVLRYYDHVFPVRPGTESLELADLVAAQCYRLCDWREGGTRLNYRRFFDVTTLAAIRVEDADVFDQSHRLLLEEFRAGSIDGFRIDHPDGLASPAGYLAMLADATGDAWVVAEKILEGHEQLPDDWRCAGTTGYDTLLRVQQVFVDPAGAEPLTDLLDRAGGGATGPPGRWCRRRSDRSSRRSRRPRSTGSCDCWHECCPARTRPRCDVPSRRCWWRWTATAPTSRPVSRPTPRSCRCSPRPRRGPRHTSGMSDLDALALVGQLVAGGTAAAGGAGSEAARDELMVRFQQTCGPVMAKAVEDTAFYRYARLTGAQRGRRGPGAVRCRADELHAFAEPPAPVLADHDDHAVDP